MAMMIHLIVLSCHGNSEFLMIRMLCSFFRWIVLDPLDVGGSCIADGFVSIQTKGNAFFTDGKYHALLGEVFSPHLSCSNDATDLDLVAVFVYGHETTMSFLRSGWVIFHE